MKRQIEIFIDKLYSNERVHEHCFIGIPFEKGFISDESVLGIKDPAKDKMVPAQIKVTSRYNDGSIRFVFIRFMVDIPANKKSVFICEVASDGKEPSKASMDAFEPLIVTDNGQGFTVSTKCPEDGSTFSFDLKDESEEVFDLIKACNRTYERQQLVGPVLKKADEEEPFKIKTGKWEVVERGPLCAVLKNRGFHLDKENRVKTGFELKITAFAEKPYTELSYRLINETDDPLEIGSLKYFIKRKEGTAEISRQEQVAEKQLDSTGCGDHLGDTDFGEGPVYKAVGNKDVEKVSSFVDIKNIRTIAASSNYKTNYLIGRDGAMVKKEIDAGYLMQEANEHFAETFYGTFFADFTDSEGGVCATIFQAQQNYPKAVMADENGITLYIVPEGSEKIVLESGMSREQKFLLHFHSASKSISSLNDRSIVYQMPYRPYVLPKVHEASGVWPLVFPKKTVAKYERNLVERADGHSRSYGMLNFGDTYDANYTAQGRGGGRLVWVNNEYDYPHACAILYARTGIRRFLDYNIAAASHWMDVDVCHYHKDPLYIGGQWEHTSGHVINGVMVCSHEWVEGLLDYYHFTGDERGLETALGIGENVMRLLDMPMYAKAGEASARETGWALRTLTALYVETCDKKWLTKCDKILGDFKTWEKEYGHWMAPYTDNTMIRVGFMISVAIGSLMRYYRHFPTEELKNMILRAVDDMVENCYMEDWGVFYYKELPSLNRVGTNTLLLEALTAAYDLSGDDKYLHYGIETFKEAMAGAPSYSSTKSQKENAVIVGSVSSKAFAQSLIPLAGFYRAITYAGIEI